MSDVATKYHERTKGYHHIVVAKDERGKQFYTRIVLDWFDPDEAELLVKMKHDAPDAVCVNVYWGWCD